MRRILPTLSLFALFLATAGVSAAQQPVPHPPTPSAWQVQTWDREQGLPQVTVSAMAMDDQGYLWLGTFGGLARFDGQSFDVVDLSRTPELGSIRISSLLFSSSGDLWIGTESGGLLRRRGETYERLESDSRVAGYSLDSLAEDREGHIWVSSPHGLARVFGDEVRMLDPVLSRGVARHPELGLIHASDRGIERIVDLETGAGEMLFDTEPVTGGLHVSQSGDIWMHGPRGTLRITPSSGEVELLAPGWSWFADAPAGGVWVLQRSQSLIWEDGSFQDPWRGHASPEFKGAGVRCTLTDRDGHLWVGSNYGVHRLSRTPLSLLPTPAGAGVGQIEYDSNGVLWTRGIELFRLQDEALVRTHEVALLEQGTNPHSSGLSIGTDGRLLMSTGWGEILRDEGDSWSSLHDLELAGYAQPTLVLETEPGVYWVLTRERLFRLEGDQQASWGLEDGLLGGRPHVLFRDSAGALWAGSTLGACRMADGELQPFRSGQEFPSGGVRTIYEDPSGALWFGSYGAGLIRKKDGQLRRLGIEQGLREGVVSMILDDGTGHVLMLGNSGISRASLAELHACLDGELDRVSPALYSDGPGFQHFEGQGGFGRPGVTGSDGVHYFGTIEGLARFEPAALPAATPAFQVALTRLEVDGVERPLGGEQQAPPGERNLEFSYSAPVYSDVFPLRFRHRLVGYDDWVDAGEARMARYTKVPPGEYRLEVEGRLGSGPWQPMVQEQRLVLQPFVSETLWFRAGAVLLGLLALAGWAWQRTRLSRLRAADLEQQVSVRTHELTEEVRVRRSTESELLAIRESLEATVEQRTAQLQEDMQRREALEHELNQAQRLEAVGRLASGVAHDFNNSLAVIELESRMIRKLVRADPPQVEDVDAGLDRVHQATDLASKLTHQLLAYSGKQLLRQQTLELNDSVRELADMLHRLIPEPVTLELSLTEDPTYIQADPGQLERVLMNLVVNAVEAIEGQGTIRVATARVERTPADGDPESPPGTCIQLEVTDDGSGMEVEVANRAFEPFFTTKRACGGTGFGLATVYGIVRQSGGHVRLETELGRGSCFQIFLPAADPAAAAPTHDSSPRNTSSAQHILLCEDQPAVGDALARTLREMGHTVELTRGPEEALALVQATHEFDLLLTDITMPGMNGLALHEAARLRDPELRVVFMTGHIVDEQVSEQIATQEHVLLHKPFGSEELSEALGRVVAK